jgi:cell division transport system permease protein
MSLRSLEIAIVETAVAIRRNLLMSFASIITAALTLGILGSFLLVALGLHSFVHSQLAKFEAAVWVDKGTSQAAVAKIQSKLLHMPHVIPGSVRLITKDAAWQKIKHDWRGTFELNGATPTQLSDHFIVKFDDPHHMSDATLLIRHIPHIETVIEAQDVVKQITSFADLVKIVGIAVAGILLLVSAFIVSNTIRLTVYARRREIKIMQLVGATNWFIRLPLLMEGTTLGVIGGGTACLMVFGASHYASIWVTHIMPMLGQFTSSIDRTQFFGGLIILGWIIGFMGTLISIQRFLKT